MEREKIRVREATLDDLPVLLEFEQGVIEAERPFDDDLKESAITYYDIEKLIEDTNSTLVVIEYEGDIIASGYAQIREARPHIKYEQFSYLGFMYVVPKCRGKGVSSYVMEALLEWSRSRAVFNIKLEVYQNNHSAIRAYEKAGFYKRIIEMRYDIKE